MRKILLAVSFLISFAAVNSLSAQEVANTSAIGTDYKTAVGIRLSNNAPIVANAITLKHFLNEKTAIEGFFSFSDPFSLGALFEVYKPLTTPGLRWFYGGGAYLGFGKEYDPNKQRNVNTNYFGGQGVVGLDYKFASVPINISLDWKPELNLISDINFEPAAIGFSARFTFPK